MDTEYTTALARLRNEHPGPPRGSEAEQAGLTAFETLFQHLRPEPVSALAESVYAADAWFNDTLKTVRGAAAIREYLHTSASACDDCRVLVDARLPGEVEGEFYLRWRMMIRWRRFQPGKETWSQGISHLRFDAQGRVVLHQDFWDSAGGLFQYLPLLGGMIRWVRGRL